MIPDNRLAVTPELIEEYDLPWFCIHTEADGIGRWTRQMVGRFHTEDGRWWEVEWEEGLTEIQEMDECEMFRNTEYAILVAKKERQVTEIYWEPIE